jgi:hypothetical protein
LLAYYVNFRGSCQQNPGDFNRKTLEVFSVNFDKPGQPLYVIFDRKKVIPVNFSHNISTSMKCPGIQVAGRDRRGGKPDKFLGPRLGVSPLVIITRFFHNRTIVLCPTIILTKDLR